MIRYSSSTKSTRPTVRLRNLVIERGSIIQRFVSEELFIWSVFAALGFWLCACKAEWEEFSSAEGEFTILLPGIPDEHKGRADHYLGAGVESALGIKEATMYSATVAGAYRTPLEKFLNSVFMPARGGYFLSYANIDPDIVARLAPEGFLDVLVKLRIEGGESGTPGEEERGSSKAKQTSDCSRTLVTSSPLRGSDYVGREVVFDEICSNPPNRFTYRERSFLVRDRVYLLTAVGSREGSEDRGEAFTADADNFFNSFTPTLLERDSHRK